jgi:tetratricopeptide (TPR) repeat protein
VGPIVCSEHPPDAPGLLEIGRQIAQDPDSLNQAAWDLIWWTTPGSVDSAISKLNRASVPTPKTLNDLGVAFLLRFHLDRRPLDLLEALNAFEAALELDPEAAEPLYNRALTIEALRLNLAAPAAWDRYLAEAEPDAWFARAQERKTRTSTGQEFDILLENVLNGTAGASALLTAADRGRVRELAIEDWIPSWGESHQNRNQPMASQWLRVLAEVGPQLASEGGDSTVEQVVQAIQAAEKSQDQAWLDQFATVCVDFGIGRRSIKNSNYLGATAPLTRASETARKLGQPLAARGRSGYSMTLSGRTWWVS